LESIALAAVRKRFSPEFVNRLDAIVTYQPLDTSAIETILDHDIKMLQLHVNSRLGDRCFEIEVSLESRQLLLRKGVSEEYGARELKRTIHRELTQPLATMVARGEIGSGARVNVSVSEDGNQLVIKVLDAKGPVTTQQPTILIVDDNRDLLLFLSAELEEEGWRMLTAENAEQARVHFAEEKPDTVLLDYMLGEDDGLRLGMQFQQQASGAQIIIMTGGGLTVDELTICEEREFPILYKPFLADAVLNLVRGRYRRRSAAASS
jgi:CheY-like chemotaxis protein